MSPRTIVAIIISPVSASVVFGFFFAFIMSIPVMAAEAARYIPAALNASILVAWPLAWNIAPTLLSPQERSV